MMMSAKEESQPDNEFFQYYYPHLYDDFYKNFKKSSFNMIFMGSFMPRQQQINNNRSLQQISIILKFRNKAFRMRRWDPNKQQKPIQMRKKIQHYKIDQITGIQTVYTDELLNQIQSKNQNHKNLQIHTFNLSWKSTNIFINQQKSFSPLLLNQYSEAQLRGYLARQKLIQVKRWFFRKQTNKMCWALNDLVLKSNPKIDDIRNPIIKPDFQLANNRIVDNLGTTAFKVLNIIHPSIMQNFIQKQNKYADQKLNYQDYLLKQCQRSSCQELFQNDIGKIKIEKFSLPMLQFSNDQQEFQTYNLQNYDYPYQSKKMKQKANAIELQKQLQSDLIIEQETYKACYLKFYNNQHCPQSYEQCKNLMKTQIIEEIDQILKKYYNVLQINKKQSTEQFFISLKKSSFLNRQKDTSSFFAFTLRLFLDILPDKRGVINNSSDHSNLFMLNDNEMFFKSLQILIKEYRYTMVYSYHYAGILAKTRINQRYKKYYDVTIDQNNSSRARRQFNFIQKIRNQENWCHVLMMFISGQILTQQFQQLLVKQCKASALYNYIMKKHKQKCKNKISQNKRQFKISKQQKQKEDQKYSSLLLKTTIQYPDLNQSLQFQSAVDRGLQKDCQHYAILIDIMQNCYQAIAPHKTFNQNCRMAQLYRKCLLSQEYKIILSANMVNNFNFKNDKNVNLDKNQLFCKMRKDQIDDIKYILEKSKRQNQNQNENQLQSKIKKKYSKLIYSFGFDQLFDILNIEYNQKEKKQNHGHSYSIQMINFARKEKCLLYCLILAYPELLNFSRMTVFDVAKLLYKQIKNIISQIAKQQHLKGNFEQLIIYLAYYFSAFKYEQCQDSFIETQKTILAQDLTDNIIVCQRLIKGKYLGIFNFVGISDTISFIKMIATLSIQKHQNYFFFVKQFIKLKIPVIQFQMGKKLQKNQSLLSDYNKKNKLNSKNQRPISKIVDEQTPNTKSKLKSISKKFQYFQIFILGLNIINQYLIALVSKTLSEKNYQSAFFNVESYKKILQQANKNVKKETFYQRENITQHQHKYQAIKDYQDELVQKTKQSIMANVRLASFTLKCINMEKGILQQDVDLIKTGFKFIINVSQHYQNDFYNYLQYIAGAVFDIYKTNKLTTNQQKLIRQSNKVFTFFNHVLQIFFTSFERRIKNYRVSNRKNGIRLLDHQDEYYMRNDIQLFIRKLIGFLKSSKILEGKRRDQLQCFKDQLFYLVQQSTLMKIVGKR